MVTESAREALTSCFYSGKYNDLILKIGRRPIVIKDEFTEHLSVMQIGALSFLGEFDEAERLFIRALDQPHSLRFEISSRFYVAIGEVRRSNYLKASKLFAENMKVVRSHRAKESTKKIDSICLFYANQGIAFYRFYKCQFKLSAKFAERAYLIAFESDFKYGQALSLDALGQSLCLSGKIRRGLYEVSRAHKTCVEIGNGGFAAAVELTQLRFRAQYGILGKSAIDSLKRALTKIDPQNSYSKCEIYLELARQLTLRGRVTEALSALNDAGDSVYKNGNKRQLARYNHRHAYLLFLQGQKHAALALLRSAKTSLHTATDHIYLREFKGLEELITGEINSNKQLPNSYHSFLDLRISERNSTQATAFHAGEDPLGDLIDLVAREKTNSLNKIVKQGLLGLIPKALSIPAGENIIYLGPTRSTMVVCGHGDIQFIESGLTAPMKSLLRNLSDSEFQEKEKLIERTWGYQYQPDVHDRLLHATIGKLRRCLGSFSNWIEWSNQGYRLNPDVRIMETDSERHNQSSIKPVINLSPKESLKTQAILIKSIELNARQLSSLKHMSQGQTYNVSDYAKRFKISNITACRDLTLLYKSGRIIRVGRARATRYGLSTFVEYLKGDNL